MSRPNVVLILSDDQRLDTLSQGAMPKTLARFAGGLTFSNGFVTTPLCGPSRVSIMTGKRVPNHGIAVNEGCAKRFWKKYDKDSLGWWLNQEAGYRAGYYGKVFNGFERISARRLPGYEDFIGSLGNRDPIVWNRNGTVRRTSYRRKNETKALADLALAFIVRARKTPDTPYFAFCAVKSPHIPLDPARARQTFEAALSNGAAQLVGVTKYVDPEPRPAAAEPAPAPAIEGGGDTCVPLAPIRLAAPFEAEGAAR